MAIKLPWQTWTAEEARQVLPEKEEFYDRIESYWEGDHWQGGAAWIGPILPEGHQDYVDMLSAIQRSFVSGNKIKEITKRKRTGLLGREPLVMATDTTAETKNNQPTREDVAESSSVEDLIKEWWDDKGISDKFKEAVTQLLLHGKTALRQFVPAGRLNEEGKLVIKNKDEVWQNFFIDVPAPHNVTRFEDPNTMYEVVVLRYEVDGKDNYEISWIDPETNETVIRIVGLDGQDQEFRFEWDGRLPIHIIEDESLITPQIIQNQNAHNVSLTMAEKNTELAGFLERYFLNAEEPEEPDGESDSRKKTLRVGAGAATFLHGTVYEDEMGAEKLATPSVFIKDPVDTQHLQDSVELFYRKILEEAFQIHTFMSDMAQISEDSRRQAMSDYARDLDETATVLNELGRWLVETFISMTSYFGGKDFTENRVTFSLKPDPGPKPEAHMRLAMEYSAAGLISRERAASEGWGVDDWAAEQDKIARERIEDLLAQEEVLKQMGENIDDPTPDQFRGTDDTEEDEEDGDDE